MQFTTILLHNKFMFVKTTLPESFFFFFIFLFENKSDFDNEFEIYFQSFNKWWSPPPPPTHTHKKRKNFILSSLLRNLHKHFLHFISKATQKQNSRVEKSRKISFPQSLYVGMNIFLLKKTFFLFKRFNCRLSMWKSSIFRVVKEIYTYYKEERFFLLVCKVLKNYLTNLSILCLVQN